MVPDQSAWRSLQRGRGRLILAAILISALIHLISVAELASAPHGLAPVALNRKPHPVKIRIVEHKPKKKTALKKPNERLPKILETPQLKTERPDTAEYAGTVNHKAVKQTRISDKAHRERAKDPGQKGKPDAKTQPQKQLASEKPPQPRPQKQPPARPKSVKSKTGKLAVDAYRPKPRNDYEALLPTNAADLPGQLNAGYQDYVDDKVEEGDRIDINTTEYRYIGYFTSMRKAIELVWNYPLAAARKGLQGEVGLEFAINTDGHATHIKVIKSSGYEILDRAIVDAIKLASPFSPLPKGFGKKRIVITGSFRYILNSYGSH